MTAYPTYKHSKTLWVDTIPEHWEDISFKYIFDIIGGNGFRVDLQGQSKGDYPFYKTSDINGSDQHIDHANNYVNQDIVDKERYNIIPQNAIIISKIGEALRKNHRKVSTQKCIIDNNLQALVAKRNDSIDYLYYLMCAIDMDWFNNEGTIPSINNDKLRHSYIPIPSISEQCIIAKYLNSTISSLDSLVAEKNSMIEDLCKFKASLINEAITKGIVNGRVVGTGPKGWTNYKLKYVIKLKTQPSDHSFKVGLENIESGTGKYVSTDSVYEGSGVQFYRGDILYGKLRPYLKKVWLAEFDGNAVGDFFIYSVNSNFCASYIKWLMLSDLFTNLANSSTNGAKMPRVASDYINTLQWQIPEYNEQVEIAEYLEIQTEIIDRLLTEIKTQKEELFKYRYSIIREAVTGKVDLRDWSAEKQLKNDCYGRNTK